ncbi:MAG TPA: hypothetical protein VMT17_12865 [Anaeromyxobacteraceae bacterium]|nr:hypothetical protein [Anaeromyxobacteraceae bacterium]
MRSIVVITLVGTLSSCATPSESARPTLKAGPAEREKAACLAGQYPLPLGAAALAQARYEDIEAQRNGSWSTFATVRLLDERAQFDRRCASWRRQPSGDLQPAVE